MILSKDLKTEHLHGLLKYRYPKHLLVDPRAHILKAHWQMFGVNVFVVVFLAMQRVVEDQPTQFVHDIGLTLEKQHEIESELKDQTVNKLE
jgi:hypothetical protein